MDSTTTKPSRTPINRELILDHTMSLLTEHGIAGFRLKDLARRLEVTIPNLYRYFKDREEIIRATFTRAHVLHCNELANTLSERAETLTSHEDLWDTLRGIIPELSSTMAQEERIIRFKAMANMHDARGNNDMADALNQVHQATAKVFARAQTEGIVDNTLCPEALSFVLRSLVAGMVIWDIDKSMNISEEDLGKVFDRFYAAIRPI